MSAKIYKKYITTKNVSVCQNISLCKDVNPDSIKTLNKSVNPVKIKII